MIEYRKAYEEIGEKMEQNDIGDLPEPFASRTVDVAFWEYQQGTAGVTG